MQTVVYRISLSKNNARLRLWLGRAFIVLAVLLVALAGFHILYAWQADDPGKFGGLDLLFYLVFLAAMLTMIVPNIYGIRPSSNFMTLDESGLTCVRFGFRQRWEWRNLPEFSVTVHPDGAKVVEFRPPAAGDWRARLGSWVVWLAGGWFARGRRIIRISDEYDAPLREVVDRLNEYRDRALGGGDAMRL